MEKSNCQSVFFPGVLCYHKPIESMRTIKNKKGASLMKQTIGQRIAFCRKKVNLTQEELAEQLNVTSQAVSKWENDLSYPDLESTGRLASVLNTTVDCLLNGEESLPPVRLAQTDHPETRLLTVSMREKDKQGNDKFDIKLRIPVELALLAEETGTLDDILDDEDAVKLMQPALKLIRQGLVGPIVDFQKDGLAVRIEVTGNDC